MPGPDDQARLAEALRANLRRRKAQARARAEDDPAQPINQRLQVMQASATEDATTSAIPARPLASSSSAIK